MSVPAFIPFRFKTENLPLSFSADEKKIWFVPFLNLKGNENEKHWNFMDVHCVLELNEKL